MERDMGKQLVSYKLMNKFAFTIAAVHTFETPVHTVVSKDSIGLLSFLLFITCLVVGIFGFCFIIYGQGHKLSNKLFRALAKGAILILFVSTTGAISNAIQNSTFDVFGSKMFSLLIAGAIGGIVAFIGVLISQEIEKLSPLRLTLIGCVCIALSIFGCLILILTILVGESWP